MVASLHIYHLCSFDLIHLIYVGTKRVNGQRATNNLQYLHSRPAPVILIFDTIGRY